MSSISSFPSPSTLSPAIQQATSGSIGTLISTCALYPLSLVISRLQVQRELEQEAKSSAAHRQARLAREAAATAAARWAAREDAPADAPRHPKRYQHARAPSDYDGIADAFSKIYNTEGGLKALYTGLGSDAAKSVLDSFLFFMFYEWFRSLRTHKRLSAGKGSLGVLEELTVGVAAGACSRAVTTPIANVVTRKQTPSMVAEEIEKGVGDIARGIKNDKSVEGLWSGYSANLLLSLNPSITFFLQDFFRKNLLSEKKAHNPSAFITFLLAATSKTIASAITYPFQTAQTRLQTDTSHGEDEDNEDLISLADRDVDYEVDKKLRGARAMRKAARRSIFGMIMHIARTEGVSALYAGLQGELLKGFLSHGLTMVAKEAVHRVLFRFYLAIAAMLHKYQHRLQSLRARFSKHQQYPGDSATASRQITATFTEDILLPKGSAGPDAVASHIQTHPLIPAPVSMREPVAPPTPMTANLLEQSREAPVWAPTPAPSQESWAPVPARTRAPPPPPLALSRPKMLEPGHRESFGTSSDRGIPMPPPTPLPPALQYRIDPPLASRRRTPQPPQRYIMNMIDRSHRDVEK